MSSTPPLTAIDFQNPAILLSGAVNYDMHRDFRAKLEPALAANPEGGRIHVELSTLGGDPEVARMMGEDIRFHSDLVPGRRFVFLGEAGSIRPAPPS